ncbi:SPOR domain-containing protein [Luteimonas yindakuii]|uniref:SPOR domain-containing protein n=1 Tax=Luteimonas yindakuii TaxID=2565782 RepID=UPI0010A2AB04|nr:SPOR domain-containing protein [Luteimonas yindakuii]QCO67024.1 SPOR domain-containing protein [Luteimonas yindakuii]
MFARATIVLLIALNLGVGLWWLLRPEPMPTAPPDQPVGVPRLRLLAEATPQTRETAALAADATPATDAPLVELAADDPATGDAPAAARPRACHRIGPFADDAALARARGVLAPDVRRLAVHVPRAGGGRGWRVLLPAQVDRAAAQAVTGRLAAAGFNDHFILGGSEANAIALGRFGSEDGARRHAAALQAAGFPAQAEAIAAADARRWLDIEVDTGFDADAARRATGAAQATPLDCAALH